MTSEEHDPASARSVYGLWLGLSIGCALAAWDALGAPGMFYDEAWLAQQARRFVEPERVGLHAPGAITGWLFGRPFPLFALPYLGALKSQLLIVPIFLFGNELAVTRLTTVAFVALASLATLAFACRCFGRRSALLAAPLLALDPTIFFSSQLEWGPFSTGFLCRALGLWLVTSGWALQSRLHMALGGLAFGLAVYNRADLVIVIAAAALGLLVAKPRIVREMLQERRSELAWIALPAALGAAPIIASARTVFATALELRSRGDLTERVQVLVATLDGSYFHRFMEVGGRFDAIFDVSAPFTLFAAALSVCYVCIGVSIARGGSFARDASVRFLAVSTLVTAIAMLAVPGATRTHHMLNLCPFAHLLVAVSLSRVRALGSAKGAGPARLSRPRVAALAALALLLASDLRVIASTRNLIEGTGGRGFWTGAIHTLAEELESEPGSAAISLDWGFHLPLLFLTQKPKLIEPFWRIPDALLSAGVWTAEGTAGVRYLVHDERYDRFDFGPRLLRAARRLPPRDVEIREYGDRDGETAFLAIRFLGRHRLALDRGGEFRIEFH